MGLVLPGWSISLNWIIQRAQLSKESLDRLDLLSLDIKDVLRMNKEMEYSADLHPPGMGKALLVLSIKVRIKTEITSAEEQSSEIC